MSVRMSPERIEEEFRATAFHEAGHAVVRLHYGQQTHVWMFDRETHGDPTGLDFVGRCDIAVSHFAGVDIPRKLGRHQDRVLGVAGPLAEHLSREPEFIDGGDDGEWSELAFALVFYGNDDLPETGGEREFIRAQKDAMKIIREWWPTLQHIAEELMRSPGPGWTSFSYL